MASGYESENVYAVPGDGATTGKEKRGHPGGSTGKDKCPEVHKWVAAGPPEKEGMFPG